MIKLYILSILLLISGVLRSQCPGELTLVNTIGASGQSRTLAYSPDGNYLTVMYLATDIVSTYSVNTNSGTLSAPMNIVGNRASYLEYSPNGNFVVSASALLNQLSIYSVNSITGALTLITNFGGAGETNQPLFVSFTPDGQFIAVSNRGSGSGAVTVYSIDQITGIPTFIGLFVGLPTLSASATLDFSPNGQYLAVGYINGGVGTIRIFSINSSTGVLTQVPGSDVATSGAQPDFLRYSPDGRFAALANKLSNIVDVYSVDSMTGIFTPIQNVVAVPNPGSLSYSPTGEFLVVASATALAIRLFAVNTNTGLLTLVQDVIAPSVSESVEYSPLGNSIAIADQDTNSVTAYSTNTVYSALLEVSPATICLGESSTLTVAVTGGTEPYTITWSDIGAQSGNSPIVRTVSPASTTTYTINSVTDANSCAVATVPVDTTVTVEQGPMAVTLSVSSTAICLGDSLTLTVGIVGGQSPYTVTYSDGTVQSGNAPFTHVVVPSSTITYAVVVTDASGCDAVTSNSITSTVNSLPRVALSRAPAAICPGKSSSITTTINGVGPFQVNWTDGFTQVGNSPLVRVVSPTTTTIYTINSLIDANGCLLGTGAAVSVIVNSLPLADLELLSPAIICQGQSATLNAKGTSSGSSPTTTIIWSDGIVNTVSGPSLEVKRTVSPLATTSYSIQVVDANGCQATAGPQVVTVRSLPAASLGEPCSTINAGQSTDLIVVAEGVGPFNVVWSDGFTQTNVNSPIIHTVSPASTTNYLATITASNGCQTTSNTITVTVIP